MRAFLEALANFLEDNEALEAVELFQPWRSDGSYQRGLRVQHQGVLYRCLQDHQAQQEWNPVDAPSLWARVLIDDPNSAPAWIQPDSTNPYAKGDRVMHRGRVWVSLVADNVWEPGVYGWEEVK
jgi:hypothetical protein